MISCYVGAAVCRA